MNLNYGETSDLLNVIRNIVRQEIKNSMSNIEYSYFGIVESENLDGTFDIKIPSDDSIYPNLLNQSGTTLSVSDSVIVRAKNNNFGNAYIACKSGATVDGV